MLERKKFSFFLLGPLTDLIILSHRTDYQEENKCNYVCTGAPQESDTQGQARQWGFTRHPELRDGVGAGPSAEDGDSWEADKSLVIRAGPCHAHRPVRYKSYLLVIDLFLAQAPEINSFW